MIENKKHIVQIVIKNTSTLDFTIPLFWHIKNRHENVKISILYCVFDRKEILRNSFFFTDFCREYNIQVYDFSDFLKWKSPLLKSILKNSRNDRMTFFEIKNKLKNINIGAFVDLARLILYRVKLIALRRSINFSSILPKISPDVVFFDNRNDTSFIGRDEIFSYLYSYKPPTYLIPHAPHMRDAISEFCPFDERGDELPDFCYFMIPFKYGTPWIGREAKKDQFFVSGYPGLDSDWLKYCKKDNADMQDKVVVNLLFIIRRFLPKGVKRTADTDIFIIDYEEFIKPLRLIKNSILKSNKDIHLIIKPHPANNYRELEKVMKLEGIKSWEISHEPMYGLLSKVDVVCSLASTVLLIPAMANIPTIIFDTSLQQKIHKRWDRLAKLYCGMDFYLDDNSKFQNALNESLGEAVGCDIKNNIRNFFDDEMSMAISQKIGIE
jgi:hypothetical protein